MVWSLKIIDAPSNPTRSSAPGKFLATRKQIVRWAGWKIDLEISVCLDGVVDDLRVWIFLGRCPNRKAEFAARLEDAERFSTRALRVRHVKQSEVGQNAIEGHIGERQILRIAFAEFDPRKHLLRNCHHFPGKIEAAGYGAALGGYGCDVAGARTNIENRHV